MKFWQAHGTEHSANLVMIGEFKDPGSAESAKDLIEELQKFFADESRRPRDETFTDEVRDFLRKHDIQYFGPSEAEQFALELQLTTNQEKVVIKTDEIEVSALMKLLFYRGAKLQVYSRDFHPE